MLLLTLLSSARTVEVAGDRDRLQLRGRTKAEMKKRKKKQCETVWLPQQHTTNVRV